MNDVQRVVLCYNEGENVRTGTSRVTKARLMSTAVTPIISCIFSNHDARIFHITPGCCI